MFYHIITVRTLGNRALPGPISAKTSMTPYGVIRPEWVKMTISHFNSFWPGDTKWPHKFQSLSESQHTSYLDFFESQHKIVQLASCSEHLGKLAFTNLLLDLKIAEAWVDIIGVVGDHHLAIHGLGCHGEAQRSTFTPRSRPWPHKGQTHTHRTVLGCRGLMKSPGVGSWKETGHSGLIQPSAKANHSNVSRNWWSMG